MKREIKFRAWSKEQMWSIVEVLKSGIKIWRGGYGGAFQPQEYVLMQYTGLKDKNGKEIYEGDIVIAEELEIDKNFNKTENIWSSTVAFVEWDEPLLGYILKSEKFTERFNPMSHLDRFEIIGNIYEHPNLLNSEQEVKECDAREAESSNVDGNKINQ